MQSLAEYIIIIIYNPEIRELKPKAVKTLSEYLKIIGSEITVIPNKITLRGFSSPTVLNIAQNKSAVSLMGWNLDWPTLK